MFVRRIDTYFRYHPKMHRKHNNSTNTRRVISSNEFWSRPSSARNDESNTTNSRNIIKDSDCYSVDRDIMPVGTTVDIDGATSQYSNFEERYNNSYASNWVRGE